MKFGSVCSGIEAASVAWNPLGWEAEWFAEIEPAPSALLAHHYPAVPNLGDMTKIVEKLRNFEITAPDILCGGTPCQAFSVAGLRKSLDDARGNLSLTFCEIANEIDSVRSLWREQPAIIFWENVPGVLNTKDNAFGCFLAGLAGEDDPLVAPGGRWLNAGYVHGPQRTVAWRVLDAQYFGVAQRRRRVFVVASSRKGFDPAAVLFEFDGLRRDTAPSRKAREEVAGTIEASIGSSRGAGTSPAILKEWPAEVAQTLDTHFGDKMGLENQHINGGGSLFVSQCLTTGTGQRYDPETETLITTIGGHFVDALPFDTTQVTSVANRSSPKYGDPCHPLAAGAHAPAIAFHPTQDPISSADGTTHGLGCGSSGGQASIAVAVAKAVRRLTPTECERLQGFPDGYTLVPYRGKLMADGPRYKALGNSWAVPVVRWIGERVNAAVYAKITHSAVFQRRFDSGPGHQDNAT